MLNLRLQRYTLLEELERNDVSVLYRGYCDADQSPILAKVLVDEYPSPSQIARLRHAYAIAKEFAWPLAPASLEAQGHSLSLIWPDPGGITLRRLLRRGPLELVSALKIAAALARKLAHLHEGGVIYKDLDPRDIMVEPARCEAWLLGFGVAGRLSHETTTSLQPHAIEGDLAYVSPEQTGRMNRRVDRRSDLYALGIVLYELVTGAPPFVAEDGLELLYCHLVRRPPSLPERTPEIPAVVEELVMRLLAKNAEDRYQHGEGVAEDLETCIAGLEAGTLARFELGRGDRGRRSTLDIPQRLYGREEELATLHSGWERVREGGTELLVVRGYSGVGKSVLVREIHRELTGAQGYFVSGKFDQLGRAVPYAPLVAAFTELVHLLLAEPEEELACFRTELLEAVGDRAGVLTKLLPELERILGPQPALAELGSSAARARFILTLQRFIAVCTSRGRPLVLFLDDLQWAELASLELLTALLVGGAAGHLLVIGAYRSNEVDADHPLSACLRGLSERTSFSAIELGPLGRGDVLRFIRDALGMELDAVAPLARILYDKTAGNPFFLIQLLVAAHDDGLLRFDSESMAYRWDTAQLGALAASENVVEFMTRRLGRLAPQTARALELAACIGHRFELGTLAVVAESTPRALVETLWPALEEGLVLALGTELAYLRDAPAQTQMQSDAKGRELALRFSHDRVQQAAYASISAGERAALHLRIGRLMLARHEGESGEGEQTFELVAHLNLGRALIEAPQGRLQLAHLNLSAGRRARVATAFEAASGYFATGIELLGEAAFEHEYELALGLHLGEAEAAMVLGAHERAQVSIDALVHAARTPAVRAEALDLRVVLCAAQGRSGAAVEAGLEGLRELGFTVPEGDDSCRRAYDKELAELFARLGTRELELWACGSGSAPPLERTVMRLARHTALAAFGVATGLGYWLSALAAHHSLIHGVCDESAAAYALLGAVVASTTTRFAEAHQLVTLALAVHEQRGAPVHEASMLGFYFVTVSHYAMHWRELLPYLERARVAGAESGELMFHAYSCSHWVLARSILGDPLDEVREDCERMLARMERNQQASAAATQRVARQVIACLEGRTQGPASLSDTGIEERAMVESMEQARMSFALYWYRTAKGMLAYLAQDYEGALQELEQVMTMIPIAFTPEARYFTALAILALEERPEPDSERDLLLARCRGDLETWSTACPANYAHRHLFVEAECARREGELERSMELYDRALDAASEHDWPRDLGLINEHAARFYLERGRVRIARSYMSAAAYAYVRWGASAHLRRLAEQFPGLVPLEAQLSKAGAEAREELVDEVDMLAFARSLQSIAREVLVDNVVEQMMQVVLHNAGAERAVLVLEHEGALWIYAHVSADSTQVGIALDEALESCEDVPVSMIRYAARLSESVVVDDASTDERFASDPYIARTKPRSLACLAMAHQGRGKGVLYLENNATRGAFTRRRLELLELLASQAMISLDNARLFDALREREAQWRALVISAPDLIMIVDREHRIEVINKLAYGLERKQVLGLAIEELLTPGTREAAREAIDRVFAGGTGAYASTMERPQGLVHLTTRIGPVLRDGVVDRVTLISSDVTEQRALEQQLQRNHRLQAVGTLAGGVAHDFNNLLSVILGAAELCEIFIGDDARVRASLAEIIEAAERGGGLTRQLLTFGRRQTLAPKRVDLGVLVTDTSKLLVRLLGQNIELVLEHAQTPCFVLVDPGQLERVVMNLGINARDAMPGGGTLTLTVAAEEASGLASLEVRDTGDGMEAAVRERIFDPFFTTKAEGKGTGLGLATVLGVVEQSGGRITVRSEPGRGSCFRVELGLARV